MQKIDNLIRGVIGEEWTNRSSIRHTALQGMK